LIVDICVQHGRPEALRLVARGSGLSGDLSSALLNDNINLVVLIGLVYLNLISF